ncbi:Metalloprotease mig-17 [Biomphalaria glabrata]|nr:A disintegrin and metalloproteinase with thrombospondin motifs 7-like [Biomphalaria glabrata]
MKEGGHKLKLTSGLFVFNYVLCLCFIVNLSDVGIYVDLHRQSLFQVTRSKVNGTTFCIQTGQFQIDGHFYKILQSTREKRDTDDHSQYYDIEPINNLRLDKIDNIIASLHDTGRKDKEKFISRDVSKVKRLQSRTTRSLTVPTYYIDVAAFVDSTAFQKFLQHAGYNKTLTYLQMREYYAFLFSGVNLVYQGLGSTKFHLEVSLTRLVVFEKSSDFLLDHIGKQFRGFLWDSNRDSFPGTGTKVDADIVYRKFSVFLKRYTSHFNYDYAMFFIGSDLWINYFNLFGQDILGTTEATSFCRLNGSSAALIEEKRDYSNLLVAAHELGHSLSAEHDGTKNDCNTKGEKFLMTEVWSFDDSNTSLHLWQFSNCSRNYIESFITKLSHTSHGRNCLTKSLRVNSLYPAVSKRLLGQEIPPSKQCELRYGRNSFDCRTTISSDICRALYCYNPSNKKCTFGTTLSGTTCGSGKVCRQGKCVEDSTARQVNETCMFGDSQKSSSEQCNTSITAFNGYCYDSVTHRRCCQSCASVFRNISGCEYGDRARYCNLRSCLNPAYLQRCCYTCGNLANQTDDIQNSTENSTGNSTTVTPIEKNGCISDDVDVNCSVGHCHLQNVSNSCCYTCRDVNVSGIMTTTSKPQLHTECRKDASRYCSTRLCLKETYRQACCYTCRHYSPKPTVSVLDCSMLSSDLVPFCEGIDCSLPIARMFCCFTCRPYNPYRRGSSPLTTSTTLKPTRPTTIADCWSGDIFYYCPVSACSNDVIRQHCCKTCRHYSPRTHRHFLKATKL